MGTRVGSPSRFVAVVSRGCTRGRCAAFDPAAREPYCTEIVLAVSEASKIRVCGQAGHATPSAALFGSPVLANAATLFIIASDRSRRPGLFAVLLITFPNSDGPKLPKTKGRSNTCAAP